MGPGKVPSLKAGRVAVEDGETKDVPIGAAAAGAVAAPDDGAADVAAGAHPADTETTAVARTAAAPGKDIERSVNIPNLGSHSQQRVNIRAY
jgi:hypothetical protein